MENNIKKGYYYGMKFHKEWLIKGRQELLDYIKINTIHNIIAYFPINNKHFYVIYDENLIKGNSNIDNFKKCNHWIYIRETLDVIFDFIIQEHIIEFIDHPRQIFLF